jgi:hypothetical protein
MRPRLLRRVWQEADEAQARGDRAQGSPVAVSSANACLPHMNSTCMDGVPNALALQAPVRSWCNGS